MINVTGLNHKEFILNAEHIEKIEEVPETLITLVNGKKYIVLETTEEVVNRVIKYKNRIFTLSI
ncbi:flagellar FlbD family protein [Desnuesiella massiliensis]|uniref:flagellar FlbD family protein n=1 Tax=Desnuesiella massiliensis TaxID=1650662 RepID=UPI0006E30D7B|nr:flagellar FlbD family protein [Desnuesiella massiliensis]